VSQKNIVESIATNTIFFYFETEQVYFKWSVVSCSCSNVQLLSSEFSP
jgi:hypothetical protein